MTGGVALAVALAAAAGPEGPSPAPAAPIAFRSRAERDEVRLGEPFAYQIVIRHHAGESYALPHALELGPFRATDGRCRREEARGEVTTTCTLTLALLDLGAHDVPEIALAVDTPAGPRTLAVPGPRVTAAGVTDPALPADRIPLQDLAPPAPVLVRSYVPLAWTAAALAAIALAEATRRRLRSTARADAAPTPPPPPEVRFARRLAALEAHGPPGPAEVRAWFGRLSEVVREYLGAITRVPALDLTTEELLAALERDPHPCLDVPALRAWCGDVDLVKFARAPAGPAECAAAVGFARDLLRRTVPPPADTGAEP